MREVIYLVVTERQEGGINSHGINLHLHHILVSTVS